MLRRILYTSVLFASLVCRPAWGIHIGKAEDGKLPLPYGLSMSHPLDQPVNKACKDGSFLMNLGPTGIRAIIMPDAPKVFKVKFVFQDAQSPAKGLISPGDHIIGANGKEFNNPHGFHRKKAGARGWQGPPFELAHAIEDAQGSDGKLRLTVLKDGNPNKRSIVDIQIKPVGRFSPTWPWNCPRSDKLLKDLCDFVFEDGLPKGRPSTIQCKLALWASGDKRAIPIVKEEAQRLMQGTRKPSEGGMVTWMWGYAGIFLGEYYNAFKDKGVLPAVKALNECFEKGMTYSSGGFSHRPFPAIEQRVASGGPKGYGAMAGPGGLSMLAQSIWKQTGLPYTELPYNRTHQAYLGGPGQNGSGTLAYGFAGGGWQSVMIRLKDPATPCRSKEGIGYRCPTGLKNAGDFVVEKWFQKNDGKWDKKMVPPTGEYSWLKSEAEKLLVFEVGRYKEDPSIQQREVVRPKEWPEPSGPIQNNHKGGGHNAPVGMGALAHLIGNKGNTSWNYLGKHMATGCAYSPDTLWDGHASAIMHAFWGVLGASRADEKDFRHFLDYTKTWIILSETHEDRNKGGLVEQPFGCQRNSTCSIARDRKNYTQIAILLLSLPKRELLITGADYDQPAPATTAKAHSSAGSPIAAAPVVKARKARTLPAARQEILNNSLLATLAKLSDNGGLKRMPLSMTFTRAKVWLKEAKSNGDLVFQLAPGSQTASKKWKDLTSGDYATLSLLLAALKPDSGDAQAMAAVYMESLGKVDQADKYFDKAGETSQKKLEKLFN